jgi:hypothetical protein
VACLNWEPFVHWQISFFVWFPTELGSRGLYKQVSVTGRVMPLKLSDEIFDCYRHAVEARQNANGAANPSTRADFLDLERRWFSLAHSYEFTEQLLRFTGERSRGNNWR